MVFKQNETVSTKWKLPFGFYFLLFQLDLLLSWAQDTHIRICVTRHQVQASPFVYPQQVAQVKLTQHIKTSYIEDYQNVILRNLFFGRCCCFCPKVYFKGPKFDIELATNQNIDNNGSLSQEKDSIDTRSLIIVKLRY